MCPKNLAAELQTPALLAPGINANIWKNPIKKACIKDKLSNSFSVVKVESDLVLSDINGILTISGGAVYDADGNFDATGGVVDFTGAGI